MLTPAVHTGCISLQSCGSWEKILNSDDRDDFTAFKNVVISKLVSTQKNPAMVQKPQNLSFYSFLIFRWLGSIKTTLKTNAWPFFLQNHVTYNICTHVQYMYMYKYNIPLQHTFSITHTTYKNTIQIESYKINTTM